VRLAERTPLAERIEKLSAEPAAALGEEARRTFDELLEALERGQVRAAQPSPEGWQVNAWVKKGILLGFRLGRLVETPPAGPLSFVDKDTFPPRRLGLAEGVRIVPGGSAVRRGTYLSPGVVIMPPAYVNVGAWIGEGSMIDSHALVGSCAQVGRRVHLSAGAMLGGVLEPAGALPVVVEDEVLVGGNCGVYEGAIVGRRAVLGSGVILTGSVAVYDLVREQVYRRTPESPLRIPEGAVVVPGSRRLSGGFAESQGLALYAPVIVKYRDEKTDAATALEGALR
jgi:2,3,4,5-tetrahydropyridine-2,6-dicarboxylate N-succinyltransferase